MSGSVPADNATRPCTRCGKPRGHGSPISYCRPCWNAYVASRRRQQRHEAAKERRAVERVPRELKVGDSPGADAFGLGWP